MTFYIASLKKGENYKKELFWPDGLEASIPFSDEIIIKPSKAPRKNSVQLYWSKRKSSIFHPLLWTNEEGQRECAIDIPSWIQILKYELYRLEHKRPLRSIVPVNYHYVPEKIRFLIISAIFRFIKCCTLTAELAPVSQFNVGCEVLLDSCDAHWDIGVDLPLLVLTHDIETGYGFEWVEKIARLEEKFGFHSLWNVVPKRYPINKNVLFFLLDSGHEIGMHGIWHNSKEAFLSEDQMIREISLLKSFIEEFKIKAYRSPAWFRTKRMYKVLSEFFSYDLSCLDNDPLSLTGNGGVGLIRPFMFESGLIELPCTLPFESPVYWGVSAGNLLDYWKPKKKFVEHLKGMLLVTTHPDPNYLGNSRMLAAYENLLGFLADNNWRAMLPRDLENNL